MEYLEMPEVAEEEQEDEEGGESEAQQALATDWCSVLTDTAKSRLTLARAFVMNPEVLVIHKPTIAFNRQESEQMIAKLRQHVDERGLALPEQERAQRRPRTVFFSLSQVDTFSGPVDQCYQVTHTW